MKKLTTSGKNRASSLLELSIDYNKKDSVLMGFSELICLISGAMYSQINLIDDENQWTVAECGMEFDHIPVESSVCYITVNKEETYEIENFSDESNFKNHPLVINPPYLKYYLGFPFKDEHGIYVGSSCLLHTETLVLTDQQIKSLKIINQQVADYLVLKKQLNKQAGLITKIRHDIRGPLSGIIGFSSLLETETEDNGFLKKVGMIKQSAKNLLEYAERGLQNELEYTETDISVSISSIIDRISSLYSMQSKLKEIELIFDNQCSDDCSINTLSSNQIINIIGNVVSNAIKFSASRSNIEISFRKVKKESHTYVKVSVEDQGIGIPKNKLKSLHQLEYVESEKITSDVTGFGIGLVEALRLLDQENGSFSISSKVNEGTKVELNLPVQLN